MDIVKEVGGHIEMEVTSRMPNSKSPLRGQAGDTSADTSGATHPIA
jgi:hypothetical protein